MRWIAFVFFVALTATLAWGGEGGARLVKIAGRAQIYRAGSWNEARPGQSLAPGDAVRALGGGDVVVEAADGKISITGKSDAVVEYDGIVDANIVPWKSARLAKDSTRGATTGTTEQFSCPAGEIDVRVRTGQPLQVVTPLLTAAVRGTEFAMRVAEDGSSSLELRRGAIDGYDRTGTVRGVSPGENMFLASAEFTRYLRDKGVDLAPGADWRALPPSVLDAVDNATFSGRFSQVYYNPVLGQVVRSDEGREGVDEAKVAKAAYIGDATLEDILANPEVNPFAPEWRDELANNPLTDAENGYLNVVYRPDVNGSAASPAPGSGMSTDNGFGQREQNASGPGKQDSGLIAGGLPGSDVTGVPGSNPSGVPETPSSSALGTARVSGRISGSGINGGGFGFKLDLASGGITEGRINGSGTSSSSTHIGFGLNGGTGAYNSSAQSFTVNGFTSGQVNGNNVLHANNGFSGTAASGLEQIGNPVTGSFTVTEDGTPGKTLTGNISGNRVN